MLSAAEPLRHSGVRLSGQTGKRRVGCVRPVWPSAFLNTVPQPACRPLVFDLTGGVPALSGGSVIDGAFLEPPRSMWKDWPAGCDDAALLAALLAAGEVSLPEIRIKGLKERKILS